MRCFWGLRLTFQPGWGKTTFPPGLVLPLGRAGKEGVKYEDDGKMMEHHQAPDQANSVPNDI